MSFARKAKSAATLSVTVPSIAVMNEAVAALLNAGSDAETDPDEVAALAASARPGTTVVPLSLIDPARLSPTGLADAALAWSRVEGWAAAQRCRILAEFDGPLPPEVRAALDLTGAEADDAQHAARVLVHRLPETLRALARGEVTQRQVRREILALSLADPELGKLADLRAAMARRGSEGSARRLGA